MEQGLKSRLYRWDCPPPQLLADYYARRVDTERVPAIEAHLAGCASCSAELEELRQFMAADLPVAAPPATPIGPSRSPRGALFARPQTQQPALALRGAGAGPLMAEAEGTTLFLDVQTAGAQIAIQAQLVDAEQDRWAGALVEIRQSGQLVATAEVDDLGSFAVAGLPAGLTELRLTPRAGRMLVLEDLDLGG